MISRAQLREIDISSYLKGKKVLSRSHNVVEVVSRSCYASGKRSCQKWSSRVTSPSRSFSLSSSFARGAPYLPSITSSYRRRYVKVGHFGDPAQTIVVVASLNFRKNPTRTPKRSRRDRPTRTPVSTASTSRGFWRVLALEEFTDVQCVIVDLAMPSLAGYQIVGESPRA